MYSIIKINQNSVILFDQITLQPVLLSLRYSIDDLVYKSYNYQKSTLIGLKYFYHFWYLKFNETLDYTFYKCNFSETAISSVIEELSAFWVHLNSSRNNIDNIELFPVQTYKTDFKKFNTNSSHYRSVCRFIRFIINTYITNFNLGKNIQNIYLVKSYLNSKLDFESKKHSQYIKNNSNNYKSLTKQQGN